MSQEPRTKSKKLWAVSCWLSAVLLLSGCILVDDFSPMWEKGKTDICLEKITESLYYAEFRRDPAGKGLSALSRVFTVNPKSHFLMLKKDAADKGGRMYRFGVVNGIFQRYRLDPTMRAQFEKDHPDAPVIFEHDTVRLTSLNNNEMALLHEIDQDSKYWEIEDQTLYNILRNPDCIYEDRDLKALAEKEKPKAKK